MNKRLIIILLFFFALFTPLIFNAPSKIYEVFAGGPIAPTPFGPGPVVPPGGNTSSGTGTTIPVQTPVAGKAFNGWNGTSFDTVTMPTPAPAITPWPASTPVASEYVTGRNTDGTLNRKQIDYSEIANPPTPAPTPTAVPASTPVAGQAVTGFGAGVSSVTRESFQAPLPTATPTPNYVVRGWDGANLITSQLDYSEIANPPSLSFDPLGTAAALITSSTSDPGASCTGLQGNFWDKVDSSGNLVNSFICTCEGADNATNCVYKSIYSDLDINSYTEITSVDGDNDFLVVRDATDGVNKKVLAKNLPYPTPAASLTATAPLVATGSNVSLGMPATTFFEDDDFLGACYATAAAVSASVGKLGWQFFLSGAGATLSADWQDSELAGHPGQCNIMSAATNGNLAGITTGDIAGTKNNFYTSDTFDFTWIVEPHDTGAIGNVTTRVGVASATATFDPPTEGIYFEHLGTDTNWFCVTRTGSAETRGDTTVAVVDATFYNLRVVKNGTGGVDCYVNGAKKITNQTGHFPASKGMSPFAMVKTYTGSAYQFLIVDYFSLLITGIVR